MTRIRPGGHGHRITALGGDLYRLTWFYWVKIGRQRGERKITRETDLKGAMKFAKKWSIEFIDVSARLLYDKVVSK